MQHLLRRSALAAALSIALADLSAAEALSVVYASQPTPQAIAEAVQDPRLIVLRAGAFDPLTQQMDFSGAGVESIPSAQYVIVQFNASKALPVRDGLKKLGVVIVGYLPSNTYQVRLNGATVAGIRAIPGVRWAGPMVRGMKVDPALWVANRAHAPAADESLVELQLMTFREASSSVVINALGKQFPAAVITNQNENFEHGDRVRVMVPQSRLDEFLGIAAAIDDLAWIERYNAPTTKNSGDPGTLQGNFTGTCPGSGTICGNTPIWAHGILGTNQIVSVADTGLDRNEAWFTTLDKGSGPVVAITDAESPSLPTPGTQYPTRKVFGYWVQPGATSYDYTSGHGTHVAGTVAGDAAGTFTATYTASTPTTAGHDLADGNAPNAQILVQDIGSGSSLTGLNNLVGTLQQAYNATVRIHTNSWGGGNTGAYDSTAADVDYFTNTHDEFLFVVAAGNDGPGASTLGSPGTAKNSLTVGGTAHAGSTSMYGSSSRGPAADGRLKPDIVAPAVSVVSAAADTNNGTTAEDAAVTTKTGTSMATPAIAGSAALVRQFFQDGFYPRGSKTAADTFNPSGAVLKAVMVNGTNPLATTTWPDNNYGWGRAWLDSNLWFATPAGSSDDTRRLRLFERPNAAGLKTTDVHSYTIANVAAGAELRVTLAWFDPEGAPGAGSTLVNNLDLEVEGPTAQIYKGNVFALGVSTTGGTADALNTVEQVRLNAPAAGSYTVRVKGTAVPGNGRPETDYQGYAVAVSGAFALPDPVAPAAPTGLAIASNNTSGVGVSFTGSAPQGFQLYRANGTCASASAGDFRMVATGAASPLVDDKTQGGTGYAYKVRGVGGDVEGAISGCVDVVSADTCTLRPQFDGTTLTAVGTNATCKVDLDWPAGSATCPLATGVTYSIQRATNPYMTGATTVASNLSVLTYDDTTVTSGTTYYYRVAATDDLGNTTTPQQSRTIPVTPTGATGPDPNSFYDSAGDQRAYMTMQTPWQITNTTAAAGSTYSYHSGKDGQSYPDAVCASIETPAMTLPAGAQLSFQAKYNLEWQYDGAVMEISTDGGTNWSDLPPAGGYPTTFTNTGNACGYAGSHGAFAGVSTAGSNADPNNGTATAVFKPFTVDLSSYAGQNVKIRWRLASDGGVTFAGFFLDEVRIGNPDRLFFDGFEPSLFMCQ
ncbi:S8 family serine peptidase [Tahibacter amnicola]|uniref:S8 family serine peptidase n=1 Tax=Tahibacter amnicola TaxID=2976241 RepID=A0ABY6BBQ2_9GAMM|nr:S8 family serine peptidase [Tahibacter amnicola]UXI66545.1 S8 family serine peptidase [Tahibacter amnicola]